MTSQKLRTRGKGGQSPENFAYVLYGWPLTPLTKWQRWKDELGNFPFKVRAWNTRHSTFNKINDFVRIWYARMSCLVVAKKSYLDIHQTFLHLQVLSVTAICPQPGIVRNLATYFGRRFEPTAQQDKSTGTLRIPSPRVKSICAKTQQDCLRTMTQKFVI